MSLLSPKQSARHCWGLCSSGSAGPEGRGEESPEALQAAGPSSSHVALTLWGCRKARPFPSRDCSDQPSAPEEPAASDHTLCVQFRKPQVRLPNSGYNPDCSGLFFLPFPNRIWACSLKGEVVRSDWPGPSARSQETSPTSRIAQRVTGSASLS